MEFAGVIWISLARNKHFLRHVPGSLACPIEYCLQPDSDSQRSLQTILCKQANPPVCLSPKHCPGLGYVELSQPHALKLESGSRKRRGFLL